MCDIRLFRSALMDYETAEMIWKSPYYDEMILNNAAYHLQQTVEKVLKGALECVGITVPNTHKISKLIKMLSEWEAETRYDMDFLVEKRKLETAIKEVRDFLDINGIKNTLRTELLDPVVKENLLACLPQKEKTHSDFELNCYYIMFKKKVMRSE